MVLCLDRSIDAERFEIGDDLLAGVETVDADIVGWDALAPR